MEFQDYAAKETSALFGRLRASHAGATLQQLQAIREAIDAAARAIETAPEPDQEIDELIAGLTAAAHEEARRAGDESRRISQEARRAIDEAEEALQKQLEDNARLAAAVAKADAETALLKSELETAQERADAAERDFLATVDAHGELEAALKAADVETRHLVQEKAHLENDLAATRATLEQAIADVDHLRHDVDRHHAERSEFERHMMAAHAVTRRTRRSCRRARTNPRRARGAAAGTVGRRPDERRARRARPRHGGGRRSHASARRRARISPRAHRARSKRSSPPSTAEAARSKPTSTPSAAALSRSKAISRRPSPPSNATTSSSPSWR